MVSWSESDNSSEHTREYISSSSDDSRMQVPASTEDSDFEGPEDEMQVLCHGHGKLAERRVAFEGILTSRRFLCCAEKEGRDCGLIQWIDPAWPNTLENALHKLWLMYEESKRQRAEDTLMNSFEVRNLTQEKNKLQASYEKLVEDVNAIVDAQQHRVEIEKTDAETKKLQEKYEMVKNLAAAQASVIRNMKLKLAEERKNLQIQIDELQKSAEGGCVKLQESNVKLQESNVKLEESNLKLLGIKAILNE
ncbi:uncharacterized protein [Aegilops tauschii subsp. strangulata]|uniref:uncharacterized protein n=1 Tax=Aegilops tauschii subsp. strangulata TaxID=200361 RepID=UPI000989D3B1|nr:uncharacterized protein LOC109758559 [Aegilops tauschii subsp. strangulata]